MLNSLLFKALLCTKFKLLLGICRRNDTEVKQRFLDNVLDRSHFPLQAITDQTALTRKIGLGIMGFADLLIHLGIPYSSNDALAAAEELMGFIQTEAHEASTRLARERGVFPAYRGSRLQSHRQRRRNATVTTIAPTGTISIIADCSAGIEPLYGIHLVRTVMDGMTLSSLHPAFVQHADRHGLALSSLQRDLEQSPSIQHLTQLPDSLRRLFVTAHDVSPAHHVRMQAAFQRHSDSGVSKTINLPATATPRDVAEAFQLAHQLGAELLLLRRVLVERVGDVLLDDHVDVELDLFAQLVGSDAGAVELLHGDGELVDVPLGGVVGLEVEPGETVAIVGPSGAGKSTILKTISGIIDPRKGSIEFEGVDITAQDPARVVQRGLVHVPEGREVFPLLSVRHNLMMGAFTRHDRDAVARDMERVFGYFPILRERADQDAGLLSGGQQQMLAISRALMAAPRMIMLDEPSLGLSPKLTKEIFEIVVRINRERGTTILLVEQNANMALQVGDFGYVLEVGRIVMADTCARLVEKEDIKEFYLGIKQQGARGQRRWKKRKTWR